MKKYIALVLAFMLILSFSGCTSDKPETVSDTEQKEVSKTEAYFEKYIEDDVFGAEMELIEDTGEIIGVELLKNGDDMHYTFTESGVSESALIKENYMYMLFEDTKTCYKMAMSYEEIDGVNDTYSVFTDMGIYDEPTAKGSEEIDGVVCEFETFSKEGEEDITYYFYEDEVKYIKSGNQSIKVISVSDETDSSKFEIPSDYYIVDYDATDLGV